MQTLETSGYRPDIDGLRGIAVLMVVAFHLQTVLSHGGFIGVDIFFVISGFLITSLLLRELEHGSYNVKRFYVRRIRRLAPALIVMLLFTTAVAYAVLWPFELTNYAWSLISAVLSASNQYFLSHLGYFDAQSSSVPLLHTWSLAVEEQFYIVFPFLLSLLYRRFKPCLASIVAGLGLVSLAISIYAVYAAPNFAFYSPASRAWELMCGSLLAVKPLPGMQSALRRNLAGVAGMALIMYAFLKDWHYTPFPGLAALPPCIGSLLVIGSASTGETIISRILSSRVLVFVGLISYSLYLWHWPLIVFLPMWAGVTFRSVTINHVIIFAVAFLIATLSWRFVERPFRTGMKELPAAAVFRIAGAAACVPVLIAIVFLGTKGVPERFSPSAVAVATYLKVDKAELASRYRTGSCFLTSDLTLNDFDRAKCLSESKTEPNILIFGDSHAAHLAYGLVRIFPRENFMQATAVSCTPYVMRNIERLRRPVDCVSLVNFILHDYLPQSQLDAVILAGHWTREDLYGVGDTIAAIKKLGIKLLLVGPVIEYDIPLPHLLALSIERSDPGLPQRHIVNAAWDLDRQMSYMAKTVWHVPYFSYFSTFCTSASCQEYVGTGIPLEQDQAHLTSFGSILVAKKFEEEQFLQ
jgi:peptidoglycan/LPS O-acetylase OafA/YrhL